MRRKILYLLMSAVLVIPSYPGAKKMWEKKMAVSGLEIKLIQYQSPDSADEILDFYTDKLVKAGWILNHRSNNPPIIYLTSKDYSSLSIKCLDVLNRGINDIVIVHSSPITQEIVDAMTLGTDFPGEDIASIPRYPGSVRKAYNKTDKSTSLIYECTQGCFDCVLRFYRAEMTARGWELLNETRTDMGKSLQQIMKGLPENAKKELPEDLGDFSAWEKYPLVTFSFKSDIAQAQISASEKEGTIFININYILRE